MTEALFAALAAWGVPALALATFLSCLAIPVPTSAMMLAAGAFAASGVLSLPAVVAAAFLGALVGDQAGFLLGRLAGGYVEPRMRSRPKPAMLMARAEAGMQRHGAASVFLSRWLFSPLGPYVNLIAGAAGLRWIVFTLSGAAGEAVWVGAYVGLGHLFADQLAALAQILANSIGLLTSGLIAALTGAALWRRLHARR